jgi:Icc protein
MYPAREQVNSMTDVPALLLQLSDPHLFADASRELYGVNTEASFRTTLTRAIATAPGPLDAILVTGDIAEDRHPDTYRRFRSVMSEIGVQVICIPGNHEDPVAMTALLDEPPLQVCGSAGVGNWRLVMLSSHDPGHDSGRLDDGELERLERELEAAGEQHVLVCLHHHAIPVGSPWLDAVGLANADALLSRLAEYRNVRAMVTGHVHQAFDGLHNGMRVLCTPSTCAQFTPNTRTCIMDMRPPGFRFLWLQPSGAIQTQVVWLDELRRIERPPDSRHVGVA